MPTAPLAGPLFDHWRAAPENGTVSVAHNPATGEPLAAFRNATPEEVASAVEKATMAFRTWGRTTPAERATLLLTLADRLEAAREDFARAETLNVGKPLGLAREEIAYDADVLRFMAGAARIAHAGAAGEYLDGNTSMTRREPLGVVGLITPWNYPLMEAMWKLAPALAAGNTVVLKPSELTPLSTLLFAQLAREVLPDGVLNLVLGDGATGAALVEHPAVRMVSLTGDVSTGRKVAVAASATLKRVHLELGGKAPALVFADAPLEAVAGELAATGYLNAGQDCTAPCRVIVEDAAYDSFTDAYCKAVAGLRCGDPEDELSHFGPVISQRQLERVEGFVERARSAGACVLVGGNRIDRPGWFHEATVITEVRQDDEIVQREVFGPVVTIQRAGSDDEMLAMANGVDYGLAASVWTTDVSRSLRFTRELAFGTVWLNQHLVLANEMPFGGFGQSGYGKELSAHAIDEYSQVKHVMLKATG
ncbi:aminobutyraldehyde dehydrogenase [Streptomyces sp. NPDC001508]|uniref:aminobutyraldehyde dehydrogenase n=1 Tax=Streptomyces sp. NPDC001508 TaxID=3154656 RepID=UPI00331BA2D8